MSDHLPLGIKELNIKVIIWDEVIKSMSSIGMEWSGLPELSRNKCYCFRHSVAVVGRTNFLEFDFQIP